MIILKEVIILNNSIKSEWNKYRLIIEKIDEEYQISLSDIIKNSINIFTEKNYNRILDLGCGTGRHALFFAQYGFEVFASDISKESTDVLQEKIHRKTYLILVSIILVFKIFYFKMISLMLLSVHQYCIMHYLRILKEE